MCCRLSSGGGFRLLGLNVSNKIWGMKIFKGWVNRISVAIATGVLKSGLGPTAEILSFAPPKESIQRKGGPDAALILRAEGFERGCLKGLPSPCMQRAASLRRP